MKRICWIGFLIPLFFSGCIIPGKVEGRLDLSSYPGGKCEVYLKPLFRGAFSHFDEEELLEFLPSVINPRILESEGEIWIKGEFFFQDVKDLEEKMSEFLGGSVHCSWEEERISPFKKSYTFRADSLFGEVFIPVQWEVIMPGKIVSSTGRKEGNKVVWDNTAWAPYIEVRSEKFWPQSEIILVGFFSLCFLALLYWASLSAKRRRGETQ